MGFFDKFMGRTRNESLISELEDLRESYNEEVAELVQLINRLYEEYNLRIEEVNDLRMNSWQAQIEPMQLFLSSFGNVKSSGEYAEEEIKLMMKRPKSEFEQLDQYIVDKDFSDKGMFLESLVKTPFYVAWRNKKANDKLELEIPKIQLQFEELLHRLRMKKEVTELELELCSLYMDTVRFILTFIRERIIPELTLIIAFFEAESLKHMVIAGQALGEVQYDYDIQLLQDTMYHKHYQFVRNAFFFYVISCKFYNTPVLTRLLEHTSDEEDLQELEDYQTLLEEQSKQLEQHMLLKSS